MNFEYTIEINFGDNRTFKFRTWKGKERRLLKEHLSNDTLDDIIIAKILVYGCMETPMYLNKDEIIYVIHRLRKESFGDDIIIPFECDCGCTYNVEVNSEDYKNISLQELKPIVIDEKTFNIKQPILTLDIMQAYIELNSTEQVYYEMLHYIDTFSISDTLFDAFIITELDDMFDNQLSIKDFDLCLVEFINQRFQFIPEIETICPECNETTTILVDYIEQIL